MFLVTGFENPVVQKRSTNPLPSPTSVSSPVGGGFPCLVGQFPAEPPVPGLEDGASQGACGRQRGRRPVSQVFLSSHLPFTPQTMREPAGAAATWPWSLCRRGAEEDAQIVFQGQVLPG